MFNPLVLITFRPLHPPKSSLLLVLWARSCSQWSLVVPYSISLYGLSLFRRFLVSRVDVFGGLWCSSPSDRAATSELFTGLWSCEIAVVPNGLGWSMTAYRSMVSPSLDASLSLEVMSSEASGAHHPPTAPPPLNSSLVFGSMESLMFSKVSGGQEQHLSVLSCFSSIIVLIIILHSVVVLFSI